MFEGFSDHARLAIVNSQEVARSLLAERIEPEHLLIAIASDPKGDGAIVLRPLVSRRRR